MTKVWANTAFGSDVFWWEGDGSAIAPDTFTPPDPDANPFGGAPTFYAGGTDGEFQYLLVADHTGQMWVDKFDADITILVDRWRVTGWSLASSPTYRNVQYDIKHLAADSEHVVVMVDRVTLATGDTLGQDFTVFDLSGTIVNQWFHAEDSGFGFFETLYSETGSYLVGNLLYFGLSNSVEAGEWVCALDISTGEVTKQYFNGGDMRGLVAVDTDLIFVNGNIIQRVQADGTVVWSGTPVVVDQDYIGLADSGFGSVWIGGQPFASSEEWSYDGVYLRTIDITENVIQAWSPVVALGPRWSINRTQW